MCSCLTCSKSNSQISKRTNCNETLKLICALFVDEELSLFTTTDLISMEILLCSVCQPAGLALSVLTVITDLHVTALFKVFNSVVVLTVFGITCILFFFKYACSHKVIEYLMF